MTEPRSSSSRLTPKEAAQIRKAERVGEQLGEDVLRQKLRECASFAHHGFTRPEDLRELAALSIVLARGLDDC